ncbi:hypothetical protein BH09BAC4_BH09BAC4_35820 [soil metagenome]
MKPFEIGQVCYRHEKIRDGTNVAPLRFLISTTNPLNLPTNDDYDRLTFAVS